MSTTPLDFKSLPISERIQLVEDIGDSIAEEVTDQLILSSEERLELHRRLAEHQAGPATSIPWKQVRDVLFKGERP